MEIVEWGPFLNRWSEEWAQARAAGESVPGRGLGFDPVDPARLAALEERLREWEIEAPLPPSLRAFLTVTDGWREAGGFVQLLAGAQDIEPYDDPYDLGEMYDAELTEDSADADVLLAGMWGRALRLSLESDATDVLLDPGDVDADGEWAVYLYHGWGGQEPTRYASFRAFMEGMYEEFYRLGGDCPDFENSVTRALDARVAEARLACLRGELDDALGVFEEAGRFGRARARLLASQLDVLLDGGRGWVPVEPDMDDPLYAAEALPLKVREYVHRSQGDGPSPTSGSTDTQRAAAVVREVERGTYEYGSPGVFGRAVEEARGLARWGDTEGAWRVIAAAVPAWVPYGDDHVAPFGLLGDPLLGPLVTPERGRQLLTTPRGGHGGSGPRPVPAAGRARRHDGLGWLADEHSRGAVRRGMYRFVLVEGIGPEELAERFGVEPLGPVAGEGDLWHLQVAQGRGQRPLPMARIGAGGEGWSFAFESDRFGGHDPDRLTHPGTELSRGTRALTVWWEPGLFHFACAEDGEQRCAFTVHGTRRASSGTLPAALSPDRLFPDPAGPAADRSDEARALGAMAETFGVHLPRFALDEGRLPILLTRPWIRPPGAGEAYATMG
ncbi:SMI1/KNR4 family protein [Streptomyces kanamyceticus]|uniref:SMI1/KNR4 family protein n=1 Tax=Streptomyces kanamyceticus TaxID=1967 RepID=A0A5J6GS31_STRKN|nr:SMI1/KNR4 family protein [Streptomyces kanamyceticus]QEU97242.1 SMI1/KNR4 family protein [Streptomyces kanamyceticus]